MDVYQTEEEQVESIKKWWAENSRALIFGVGLAAIGTFGWQSWKEQAYVHSLEASDAYQQLAQSVQDSEFDAALLLAAEVETSFADTPYAILAGLQKAKAQIAKDDRKGAVESLEKVAASDGNSSIRHVARVRAFRIRIGDGELTPVIADIDSVIAEKNGVNPGEFIGQYEALKGDAYRLLGDVKQARYGYIAALKSATLERRLIQLKLDDLGPPLVELSANDVIADKQAEPTK